MRALVLLLACLPGAVTAIDRGADGEFSERSSMHFVLLEDVAIHRDARRRRFERQVLELLEAAYRRVGDELGLRPRAKQRAIVYDPGVFDARFAGLFGFRTVGFYDRLLHVRGGDAIDNRMARTLHHEYTHAALDAASPGWPVPGWINEGLAEWFEALAVGKRGLSRGERQRLGAGIGQGAVPSLARLEQPSFATLGPEEAGYAYLLSYAAIDRLSRGSNRALRRFVDSLLRTRSSSRALRKVFRLDLEELEAELVRDLTR